jgi:hypothetical protein
MIKQPGARPISCPQPSHTSRRSGAFDGLLTCVMPLLDHLLEGHDLPLVGDPVVVLLLLRLLAWIVGTVRQYRAASVVRGLRSSPSSGEAEDVSMLLASHHARGSVASEPGCSARRPASRACADRSGCAGRSAGPSPDRSPAR